MLKNWIFSERGAPILLIAFAVLVRGLAVYVLNIEPDADNSSYMHMATSLVETGHMVDDMKNIAYYSVGWPLFLSPFFAVFGATPEVGQAVNVILGMGSVLLVYYCAKEVLPSWKNALFAAFLWASYTPAILFTEFIAKENLMIPLLLLQVLLLLKFSTTNHKIVVAALLGSIFALELPVGPAVILTLVTLLIVILGVKRKKNDWAKLNWRPAFFSLLFCIITIAPWLSYTAHELGEPVLNTSGSFNVYLGNNRNSGVEYIGIQDTPIADDWHAIRREKGELGSSKILREKAIDYIVANPGRTVWLSIKKVAYFWMPPIHERESGDHPFFESVAELGWLIYYCLIIILALVPLVVGRKIDRSLFILYGTVILYCAIHALTYVIFRYRLPIMPIMCILASQGLNQLYLIWCDRDKITDATN
ncbi:MAG: glycosyltransferase family 39 protein [Emcibacteraceae bacterium]|nr:glycosyltransferase family 39 protein [Emcibacteraceae bacterium]